MIKIGKFYRDKITAKVQDGVTKESSAFVVNFRNVPSSAICTLRKDLKQKNAKVYLSRNSLASSMPLSPAPTTPTVAPDFNPSKAS